MKENKQVYIIGSFKDDILFYHSNGFDFHKIEGHEYVIIKDLKTEFKGTLYNGYYENLKFSLDLKQLKIEIFE